MDANNQSHKPAGVGRRYQRHSLELKRRIVEQTLIPVASVARIAREHCINANLVFNWHRLYREGLLGTAGAVGLQSKWLVSGGFTTDTPLLP